MGNSLGCARAIRELDFHVLSILDKASPSDDEWVALHLRNFLTPGITRDIAAAICRSLRDCGFAEFHKGLWTDEGEPAGAGYAITKDGRAYLRALKAENLAEYRFDRADHRFDLAGHLTHQRAFSDRTFGPGLRTDGVSDHILKELVEVSADPTDLKEWIDVILLAFDGASRCAQHLGLPMSAIVDGITVKQQKNESREWPDWRTADPNKAIEHKREA